MVWYWINTIIGMFFAAGILSFFGSALLTKGIKEKDFMSCAGGFPLLALACMFLLEDWQTEHTIWLIFLIFFAALGIHFALKFSED